MKARIPILSALLAVGVSPLHAATIAVTSTSDSGPGSLRGALANAGNGDTIDATGIAGTIVLTSGQLVVSNSVSIIGPGPRTLVVNGNLPNTTNRVFLVSSNLTVTITSLTITNGFAFSSSNEIPDNFGGGIHNDHSTLTVSNCTLSGNSGGGIYNDGENYGSAILTVVNSTLSGNSGGGGIGNEGANYGSATLTVSNSTLSGNSANSGGGIYNLGHYGRAQSMVASTTFSGNSGGGIVNYAFTYSDTATVAIVNTILNAGASGASITNISGIVTSLGYNLSSDTAGGDDHSTGPGGLLNATGDIRNTDPMLGPLTDNGGPTFTHALLPCSPAIDQGASLGLVTDQRGYPRTYDDPSILNAGGGNGTDIGAFEVQLHQSCAFAVTAFRRIGTGKDLRLSYTTVLGSNYVVQTRSNMGSGSWTRLPGNNPGIGVVMQSIVTNGFAAPQGFYRVQQSP